MADIIIIHQDPTVYQIKKINFIILDSLFQQNVTNVKCYELMFIRIFMEYCGSFDNNKVNFLNFRIIVQENYSENNCVINNHLSSLIK